MDTVRNQGSGMRHIFSTEKGVYVTTPNFKNGEAATLLVFTDTQHQGAEGGGMAPTFWRSEDLSKFYIRKMNEYGVAQEQ